MAKTILIIEDETAIQNIVRAFLEDAGYTVYSAGDGLEGIETFRRCNPDLVLLDLMLPKIDGFAVCEILRKESRTPIIMLTARDDDASQMKGFDVLADDYIIKPFSMPLVLRRIEAVLRRTEQGTEEEPSVIRYKEITLDAENYEVLVGTDEVSLTSREFEILKLLLENPGKVFSRESLLDSVWGYEYYGDQKIVNTHIKNMRYEVGKELFRRMQDDPKCTAKLEVQLSVLPSYTRLGMAALLPHAELTMTDDFKVLIDGMPCDNLTEREAVLQKYSKDSTCVQFDNIKSLKVAELRSIFTGKQVVYVYHNQIDARGDKPNTEDEVFVACQEAIAEIIDLIRRISTSANTYRFMSIWRKTGTERRSASESSTPSRCPMWILKS